MLTYILGAGASYGVIDESQYTDGDGFVRNRYIRKEGIPVVKNIPKEFDQFIQQLKLFRSKIVNELELDSAKMDLKINNYGRLIHHCEEILRNLNGQLSFDTYAKKLWLTGNAQEYKILNIGLSCFLMYQEAIYPFDKRYDGLFASLIHKINDLPKLPANVNIVTWNYDLQIQRSLSTFANPSEYGIKRMGTGSAELVAEEFSPLNIAYIKNMNIFRLNGSIRYVFNNSIQELPKFNDLLEIVDNYFNPKMKNKILLDKIVDYFCTYIQSDILPFIFYSWNIKENNYLNKSLDEIKNRIKSSDQIIIIGYSFPVFNRAIDKIIFENLNPNTNIFIQDIEPEKVKTAFLSICKHSIDLVNTINDVSQFYIPIEYNLPS